MALEVGKAFIQLVYDAKSGKASLKAVKSETEKDLSAFGNKIGTMIGKLSAKALVGGVTALSSLAAASVKSYAELEQLEGGIESMFGGIEKGSKQIEKVQKLATKSWKTLTMSEKEYYKTFASTYPLMKTDIKDQNKAIEATNRIMTLNSDLANTFGYSMETATNAVNWALKGTYSYLDNLNIGIKGTKQGFMEAAKALGYTDKQLKNLKSTDILDILEKQAAKYGVLGKTAKEAATTISGSWNSTKASWENVVTNFVKGGDKLDEAIDSLVENIKNLAEQVIPKFFEAFGNIYKSIFQRHPVITTFVTALAGVAVAVMAITTATKIWTAVTAAAKTVAIATNFVIAHSPIFLIAGAIALIIAGIVLLVTHIKEVGDWFMWLGNIIGAFFGDFSAKAMEVIDGFQQGFRNAIENVKNWFAGIPAFFAGIFGKITGLFKNIGTKIGEVVSGAFKAVVNGILSFIEGFLNTPIDAVNGLIETINNVPGVDIPRLNRMSLPRLAKGGLATGSTLANIGEAGAEAVIPLERNTENWARPLAQAIAEQFSEQGIGGAGITVYMTNNINNNLDADEIGRRLMTSIRRAA